MKKGLVVAVTVFICQLVKSQTWTWDSSVVFNSWSGLHALATDGHRNLLYQIPQGPLVKMDASANIIWTKPLVQNGWCNVRKILCTPDSFIYVSGHFSGSVTIGSQVYIPKGGVDFFISKLDWAGNNLWTKQLGGTMGDEVKDLCVQGNYIAFTGHASDTFYVDNQPFYAHATDFYVGRISASGVTDTVIFPARPGTQPYLFSYGYELEADGQGNLFVIGDVMGKFIFDTVTVEMNSPGGAFIVKLDQNLAGLWGRADTIPVGTGAHPRFLLVNKQGDPIYSMHPFASYGYCQVMKRSAAGGGPALFYDFPTDSKNRVKLTSMTLDSCGNLYYSGSRYKLTYPNAPNLDSVVESHSILNGALSTNGAVIWEDENATSIYGQTWSAALLAPNELFIGGVYLDELVLRDTLKASQMSLNFNGSMHPSGNFIARLQNFVSVPLNITTLSGSSICFPAPVTLSVASTGAVTWYNNLNSTVTVGTGSVYSPIVFSANTYTYFAEASSCGSTTSRTPVTFTILPSPQVNVNSGSICAGAQFTINPTGAQSYQMPGPVVSPANSSTFLIVGTNANGCSDTAYSIVNIHAPVQPTITTSINFMCPGQTVTLSVSGVQSYTWHTGHLLQPLVVSPAVHTNYSVTTIDLNGCAGNGYITQYVADCLGIEETMEVPFSIYPNPSGGQLVISATVPTEMFFSDATGRVMYRCTLNSGTNYLDLQHLEKGLYFISRSDGRGDFYKLVRE